MISFLGQVYMGGYQIALHMTLYGTAQQTAGGPGKNIALDLLNEFENNEFKIK